MPVSKTGFVAVIWWRYVEIAKVVTVDDVAIWSVDAFVDEEYFIGS